jgi:hypothetical protein
MKIIIVILTLGLLVGTTAGYVAGSRQDVILNSVYANTKLIQEDNKYTLNYVCYDRVLSSFNVDNDHLSSPVLSLGDVIRIQGDEKKKAEPTGDDDIASSRLHNLLVGFVTRGEIGGGATIFGKTIMGSIKDKDREIDMATFVLGAVSGYHLGYRLGSQVISNCHNFLVVEAAQKAETWKSIKNVMASRYLLQILGAKLLGTDNITQSEIRQVEKEIEQNQIGSQTFEKLELMPEPSNWYSVDNILIIYIPVLLAMALIIVVALQFNEYIKRRALSPRFSPEKIDMGPRWRSGP